MSANKESNLVQAYIELNKFCQNGDYDRALKASGKILQIAPTEQKAFHCKVICHIQLHNFKEALTALTSSKNAALAADLHFEKAYTQDGNVFDSRKRMKAATADGLEHKLNSRQRSAIAYNQALLAIYSNQPDFCKQCCVKLVKEFGDERRAALIEASSLAKEGKKDQAVALLLKHGGNLQFAAVQILLSQGDKKAAVKLLEESEFKYRPGVVGVLCTLLSADNELGRASQLFTDVYEHYKKDEQLMSLRAVWRAAAAAHARAGRSSEAAAAHEALARAEPADKRSLARLVKALAPADPRRAAELAAGLPPIHEIESKIDIDALESSKWMMGAKVVKKTVQSKQEQSPGTPGSELLQKKKQKRRRKTKLPPNADLSKPPDPERWLPKYERTAYRKRRGVRRDVIKGSQGMSTTATDQYDMSKQQTTPSSAASAKSPRVESKQTESAWQRKQQQKKKGKGRKW
ncbi:hypothetical protein O3G_MSEX012419 [Manduca sexta]|uniref:Signal recognition particle SRP72 subunit RNA-binding domain-containing protein n=1 Tax=Manduca sexta TaxID=7130 RepID=A0A921ZN68_MANSE|nr:hypothetical protein O3G_MSEX012419 [Manduca sexta]